MARGQSGASRPRMRKYSLHAVAAASFLALILTNADEKGGRPSRASSRPDSRSRRGRSRRRPQSYARRTRRFGYWLSRAVAFTSSTSTCRAMPLGP